GRMKTWEEMSTEEIDALVAERVMGLDVRGYAFVYNDPEGDCYIFDRASGRRDPGMFLRPVYVAYPGMLKQGPVVWEWDDPDEEEPDWHKQDRAETIIKFHAD